MNTIARMILLLTIVLTCHIPVAFSGPPPVTLGSGYADLSKTTGRPWTGKEKYYLEGSVSFVGYQAPADVLVPPGMLYMSFYVYGAGYETSDFCTQSDFSRMCNFPVTPGARLSDALRHIPSSYQFAPNYSIPSTTMAGICNGWVLSATKNAATAAYAIGTFTCGVRPPDTTCQITPSSLDITLTVNAGDTGHGQVSGTLTCNRDANVRVRTPAIPDSRLSLGSSEGAPIAVLTINDRPAWSGADIHVNGSSGFVVTANIERTDTAGEYSGSTALVIEYL